MPVLQDIQRLRRITKQSFTYPQIKRNCTALSLGFMEAKEKEANCRQQHGQSNAVKDSRQGSILHRAARVME